MKYLATLFTCIFSVLAIAQDAVVSGQVLDQNNLPLPFVNVLLTDANDVTSVKGASTDEAGKFTITGLDFKAYILKASFLGYESFTNTITINSSGLDQIIVLKPSAENLDEVVLSAKKPTLVKTADRLTFNVANTALVEGNILDQCGYSQYSLQYY